MIAEEVAPVIPEVVSFQGGTAQGIDYSRLTAYWFKPSRTAGRDQATQSAIGYILSFVSP